MSKTKGPVVQIGPGMEEMEIMGTALANSGIPQANSNEEIIMPPMHRLCINNAENK